MHAILTAVVPVVIIGLVCGLVLSLASKLMAVKENEKIPKLRECLPGANCGACGYTGCDGYAKALAEADGTPTNLCVPGGETVAKKLSEIAGVKPAEVAKRVAAVHCGGDCDHTRDLADYVGIKSCAAAKLIYGGAGSCGFGCVGLGDCKAVCPRSAIYIENGLARVNAVNCVGCGLCAKTCPNHLISLIPAAESVVVTCSSRDKGAVTRKVCSNGCIGCTKCERRCPLGAVKVANNVAVIDYEKCSDCPDFGACARGCTTGCITIQTLCETHADF